MKHTIPFTPRLPELLALEGNYNGIVLSCRHRDILRCSTTRHFDSCFAPGLCNELQPVLYCYRPEICIIFKRDRSGAFIGRVFGSYYKESETIVLSKIYGNNLTVKEIRNEIGLVKFAIGNDVYFPVP